MQTEVLAEQVSKEVLHESWEEVTVKLLQEAFRQVAGPAAVGSESERLPPEPMSVVSWTVVWANAREQQVKPRRAK